MVGKRSRDSCSPSGSCSSSDVRYQSPELDDTRVAKIAAFDRAQMPSDPVMQCSLPPHATSLEFSSLDAFEVHYAQEHTNRCSSCGKNFPSAHFLSLHLDESHNPLREALAAQGEKTYACLLESCDKKSSTPQKRRLHMVDKHAFPKAYDYRVIVCGIDGRSSLLRASRRRRVSVAVDSPSRQNRKTSEGGGPADSLSGVVPIPAQLACDASPEHERKGSSPEPAAVEAGATTLARKETTEDDVHDLEASFSALRFVPRSIPRQLRSKASHGSK